MQHYNVNGWHEGRNPSAYFSTSKYLQNYGDVANAGINPYQHFISYGIYEGRQPFGSQTYNL